MGASEQAIQPAAYINEKIAKQTQGASKVKESPDRSKKTK
jgi:hypothetical protein